VRVLLVSTYELGHQPLGIAGPAGQLRGRGHDVHVLDLAVQPWDDREIAWAEAVAISVPMHTALRLALEVAGRLRLVRPDLPIALHGLYAGVAVGNPLIGPGDLLAAGDVGPALAGWLEGARIAQPVHVDLGAPRKRTDVPDRAGLPPLDRYARLVTEGGERTAGYVEASVGCAHRCRHCPVPVVYGGRTRAVDVGTVLADVAVLVEAGAEHLTFGDPDFLNRPAHALDVARAVHAAFPGLTFDITVKVEHVLRHERMWAELAACGCLFVVSAFESVDDRVLSLLDKGHTRADAVRALRILRQVGVTPRPSLLPFTPWTTFEQLLDLLDFVAVHDLVPDVDPVQYGIRLLLPPGSLLLESPGPELAAALRGFDAEALTWRWEAADPRLDALQAAVARVTEDAASAGEPVEHAYRAVRAAVYEAAGRRDDAPPPVRTTPGEVHPRLTESWYCCAEPTTRQLDAVGTSRAEAGNG
jgi:radical SAM superfamily enzyme YgiQ (UPF0313 family)